MSEPASESPRLQPAGTLLDDALYIERAADAELLGALEAGEPCFLLAPRQIGKSSLRVRTARKLRAHGVRVATIDLTRIGGAESSLSGWYYGVVQELWSRLRLEGDPADFWERHRDATPLRRWVLFLRDRVLPASEAPLVIFIDEIDTVLSLPFSSDDFFGSLRDAVNLRSEEPAYRRLTFCLLGVATPGDLMHDAARTPFNVGRQIALHDFTREEARALLPALGALARDPEELLSRVMAWTSGHPYMTMRICQELQERHAQRPGFDALAGLEPLVRELFLLQGRAEDPNLSYAERRLLASPRSLELLSLYGRLRAGESIPAEREDALQLELRLTGTASRVVRGERAELVVRNQIFAEVFDAQWVHALESERMLAQPLARWLSAQRSDDAVLRGAVLEEALRWAQGRQGLSADESAFLLAGLAVARREEAAQREAERDRASARSLRRTAAGFAALALGLVLALAYAVHATKQARRAAEREQSALALVLASVPGRELEAVRAGLEGAAPALEAGELPLESAYTGLAQAVRAAAPWPLLLAPAEIGATAVSADGSHFAAASAAANDARLFVWNLATSPEERLLQSGRVSCIAVSPDGDKLARTSVDASMHSTLEVLELASGRVLLRLPDSNCASWAPRADRLAVTQGQTPTVVDFPSGRTTLLSKASGSTHAYSPTFAPDGRSLAARSFDRLTLLAWDAQTLAPLFEQTLGAPVEMFEYARGGAELVLALRDGTLLRLDARSGLELGRIAAHAGTVAEVAPDGKTLAVLSQDASSLIDLSGARAPVAVDSVREQFVAVAFAPDSRTLAAVQRGARLCLYDRESGQMLLRVPLDAESTDVSFTPDGRTLLVADEAGHTHVLPLGMRRPDRTLELEAPATQLALAPRGELVAALGDAQLTVFDGSGPRLRARSYARGLGALAFSPDGQSLVFAESGGGLQRRALDRAQPLWQIPLYGTLAFDPRGDTAWLSLVDTGELRQVDAATGRTLQVVRGAYPLTTAVQASSELAVGPRGTLYLATSTALYALAPGAAHAVELSDKPVQDALASPDGALVWLATGSQGTFALDAKSGELRALFGPEMLALPDPDGSVAFFLARDRTLSARPGARAILEHGVSLASLSARACQLLRVRQPSLPAPPICGAR